jgi:hypothetical protein
LRVGTTGAPVCLMKRLPPKAPLNDQLVPAIDEVGGERLEGSGFESEKPEQAFSGASVLASTFIGFELSAMFASLSSRLFRLLLKLWHFLERSGSYYRMISRNSFRSFASA